LLAEAYYAAPKEVLVSVTLEAHLVRVGTRLVLQARLLTTRARGVVQKECLTFAWLEAEVERVEVRSVGIFQVAKIRVLGEGSQCRSLARATIEVSHEGHQVEMAFPCRDRNLSAAGDVMEVNIVTDLVEVKEVADLAEVKEVAAEVKEAVGPVESKEVEVKEGWVAFHLDLCLGV